MKIDDQRSAPTTRFDNLSPGDVFEHAGQIFLVITTGAVCVSNGVPIGLKPQTLVTALDVELVILDER